MHIPGIGARRLQIVVMPAFDQGYGWDLRTFAGEWRTYRSRIVDDGETKHFSGYDELAMPGERLQAYFDQLCAIQFPLRPLLNSMAGCDGTIYTLTIQGDLYSVVRLEWWSEYPEHWQAAVRLTETMIADLRQCPLKDGEGASSQ
ncbi:MAG TPA: hypothetical protein VD886_07070 [Herpetosiphonaceae bacterium]|nr:hypothetical protein [Herpetosiphonaceae bacterium]